MINGELTWVAGTWNQTTTVVSTNSTVLINGGSGDNDMNYTVLTNNGTVKWISGRIRVGNGAQIYNYGLWDCQSDQTVANDFGGDASVFTTTERSKNLSEQPITAR